MEDRLEEESEHMRNKILIFLLMSFFLIASASALSFDNTPSYTPDSKVVTVENAFGLGDDIGVIGLRKLTGQSDVFHSYVAIGTEVQVMEFSIDPYSDYDNALGSITAKNVKQNNQTISKTFIFKIKSVESVLAKNGTYYEIVSWTPISDLNLKTVEGAKTIGVFTDVHEGDVVDIIPEIFGVKMNRWAIYEAANLGVNTAYGGRPEFNGVRFSTGAGLPAGTKLIAINYHCGLATADTPQLRDSSHNVLATGSAISGCNSTFSYTLSPSTSYEAGAVGDSSANSMYWSNPNPSWPSTTADGYITWVGGRSDYSGWLDDNTARNIIGLTLDITGISAVNLTYPANNSGFLSASGLTLNATASMSAGTSTNATLFFYNSTGSLLWTNFTTYVPLNKTNFTVPSGLSQGTYRWKVGMCGTIGPCVNSTTNSTFSIDSTLPIVNILAPLNGTEYIEFASTKNVSFNISATDNVGFNNCWYFNNSANVSTTCNQNLTLNLSAGFNTLRYYANDTATNLGQNTTIFLINYVQPQVNFSQSVAEGENTTIFFNITATSISTLNATLLYNGTSYAMSGSFNSTAGSLSKTVTAPVLGSTNAKMSVVINYTLDGQNFATASLNQTILVITPIIVAASCNTSAINYTSLTEQNLTALNVTVTYNFVYGISNSTSKTTYGTLGPVSSFQICFNQTVSNFYNISYGEIDYSASGFTPRRNYLYNGTLLTNQTINTTLYSLETSNGQIFTVQARDTGLNPYVNYFISLLRWYPQLNSYQVVDIAKTDGTGTAPVDVKMNDVDYRFSLNDQFGNLVKLDTPTRLSCSVTPCTYNLQVGSSGDYTTMFGVQQNLSYDNSSQRFVYVFNDPSRTTSSMNMTVYKDTGASSTPICATSTLGYVGVLSCPINTTQGLLRAVVFRSASPAQPISELIQSIGSGSPGISLGLKIFIGVIFAVFIALIGVAMGPVPSIITTIVSGFVLIALDIIDWWILSGFIVLGFAIYHVIKRNVSG